jgi:hypothetical protein
MMDDVTHFVFAHSMSLITNIVVIVQRDGGYVMFEDLRKRCQALLMEKEKE